MEHSISLLDARASGFQDFGDSRLAGHILQYRRHLQRFDARIHHVADPGILEQDVERLFKRHVFELDVHGFLPDIHHRVKRGA